MLAITASRSLPTVAQLAEALCLRARGAGARGIAEAAGRIRATAWFKMPAYDPVSIAVMGFGILLLVALAFAF
jgi:hypothetical protein